MNTFVLEKWDDEGKICTFYTVKWDGNTSNEADSFFNKYEQLSEYQESTQELLSLVLDVIGDTHGAKEVFFNRFENEVIGLPMHGRVLGSYFPNFPLRLYALRINQNIVVLFNGGVKDGATNQTSSLHLQWQEACQFARKIDDAITRGEILIDENKRLLIAYDNSTEIIL